VRLDAVFKVVADRAHIERVLDRAVRALGHLQLLVDAHDRLVGELIGGAGGAHHVDPVERGLAGDLLSLALVAERAVGDLERAARRRDCRAPS
jgi:hypothetical protein